MQSDVEAKVRNPFLEHPNSVGEGYWAHARAALGFAGSLWLAGFVCLVHALLPFAFEKTGSRMISRLHDRMVAHRIKPENMAARAAFAPAE